MSDRLIPAPVGPNAEFYAFLARGELRLQRCIACGTWRHPPRHRCAACGSVEAAWETASGRGRVFTWTVVRRAFLPAFEEMVPFVTALVSLEEDPAVRIVSYIVDCEPDALAADLPVEAVFRPLQFATVPDRSVPVPMFVPAAAEPGAV